jgi:hypothetical protein
VRPDKHLKQIDFLDDPARFKFLLAGRRGGKTVGMVEDVAESIPTCPNGGELFYIGPTNQGAMELAWEKMEERFDELKWKCKPRISEQCFHFTRGRKVYIIGAEKIRRVRGHKLWRAYLDEVAFFTEDLNSIWRAVRPALSDLRGEAVLGTTPNGKGTPAYDFYLSILQKPDWKYFHWKTLDNPFISAEEIEDARHDLDEKSFRQEYEAQWESFEGLAYYCFNENEHIKSCKDFDFRAPVAMCLDFNVNPTSLILAQYMNGKVSFRREYSQKNSSTVDTMKSFCEDFKAHRSEMHIEIHGDATGNSRKSSTGRSDYFYIEEILAANSFNFQKKVLSANPAIIDRVAYVNAWLKNVKGESRIEIDGQCVDLIRDLSSQVLEGRFPSDKNNLGHKADAIGYYINWLHIIAGRRPQGSIQL